MKKLFTALLLLVGFAAFSQSIGRFRYDSTIFEKVGGNNELILLNSTRDSVGVLFNIGNGRTRFRTLSSLGISPNVANGITKSVDTLILGDSLNRYTYLYAAHRFTNNTRYNGLQITNDTTTQDPYPYFLTYNPSALSVRRIYSTTKGDIDSAFYGGNFSSLWQMFRDSTDALFAAGIRSELLPGIGMEAVGQYFPPRDSMVLKVGRDGQSGNTGLFQLDIGNSWGYNINVVPGTSIPLFPISTVRTAIDLSRVSDNTRRKKMTGAGVSGLTTMYKSYQTAINMSTYEAGNYTENIFGLRAYGDIYPNLSGATKAKTLAVWEVKNAYGLYVDPQYRYTNTVNNGYGVYAAGDTDINVFKGFSYFGNNSPVRENNTEGLRYRIYTTGKGRFTDSLISDGNVSGFIVQGQGLQAGISPSIGTQAGMGFFRTDSMSQQMATIFAETAGTALTGRYLAIRIGGNYTEAQSPSTSTGHRIRFETGPNQANVTTDWRNGNWSFGNSATILNYRLYKKAAFDGAVLVNDSLTVKNLPQAPNDSTSYYNIWADALGNFYRGYHNPAGGGGGGSGTVNSGTANRLAYYASTGTAVSELAAITANRALISDANGLPTHATTTDTEIGYVNGVTSAIQTQLDARWSLAGNSAVAGSQTGSFIGTTNSVALRFGTNGSRRIYLDSARNQLVIGSPTINATDGLIVQGLTNTVAEGLSIYTLNNAGFLRLGWGGMFQAGNFNINTSTGAISLTPGSGTLFGLSAHSNTASAAIHIKAPTTAAGGGQIKFIEGSRQTTPENGTLNYVSDNLEFVETSTVYTLAKTLTATATLDFDLTAVNYQDLTITVTGAAVNDAVSYSVDPGALVADVTYSATVTATNTVTIRCSRVGGGGAANPASGTFRAAVLHY